jgi:hypothetical protein
VVHGQYPGAERHLHWLLTLPGRTTVQPHPEGSIVYSQFHKQLAKADPPILGPRGRASARPGRGHPPPRRLRGHAAHALASAAQRLDRERARRAIA